MLKPLPNQSKPSTKSTTKQDKDGKLVKNPDRYMDRHVDPVQQELWVKKKEKKENGPFSPQITQ